MRLAILFFLVHASVGSAFIVLTSSKNTEFPIIAMLEDRVHYFDCKTDLRGGFPQTVADFKKKCGTFYSVPQINYLRSLNAIFHLQVEKPHAELADWYLDVEAAMRDGVPAPFTPQQLRKVEVQFKRVGQYLGPKRHTSFGQWGAYSLGAQVIEALLPIFSSGTDNFSLQESECRRGWIEAPLTRVTTLENTSDLHDWIKARLQERSGPAADRVRLWIGNFALDSFHNRPATVFQRHSLFWVMDQNELSYFPVQLFTTPDDNKIWSKAIVRGDNRAVPHLCWRRLPHPPERNSLASVPTKNPLKRSELAAANKISEKDWSERAFLNPAIQPEFEEVLGDIVFDSGTASMDGKLALMVRDWISGGTIDKAVAEADFQKRSAAFRNERSRLETLVKNLELKKMNHQAKLTAIQQNITAVLNNSTRFIGDLTANGMRQREFYDQQYKIYEKQQTEAFQEDGRLSDEYVKALQALSDHKFLPEPD